MHAWHGSSPWAESIGTRRRLQALSAAGWSTRQLAERLGVTKTVIAHLRRTDQFRVLASTAADVTALYEGCWWRTPPGRYQVRVERYAQARSWIPPWRWEGVDIDDPDAEPRSEDLGHVDQVAIDETIAGRRVALTKTERHRVVEQMHLHGASSAEIAARLGRSARTVDRYEAASRARQLQGVV